MNEARYNRGLHSIAILTAAGTFPLIFMGGLVTSHGAGMSVPDWPNSYGYNMFLFPPRLWIGGILYEHTHRLMGTVVGMLSILQCVWAWRTEPRRWICWLATAVLAAVIVQGVLGGLRVILVQLDLAIVHACFAQAFFCLTALMCVVTSRWWHAARDTGFQPVPDTRVTRGCICAAALTVAVIYGQLIVGAVMRHYGAGLAIPDLPLAYGKVLPPTDSSQLAAVNSYRAWQLHEPPVTMLQVWAHFAHRVGAIVVTLAIGWTVVATIRGHRHEPKLLRPATLLIMLLLTQLTLGILTVLMKKPADIASAHVAVGALTLVTCFVLTVRLCRLYVPRLTRDAFPIEGAIRTPVMAVPA